MRKKKYKPKIRNKLCVCRECGNNFYAAEKRALICSTCLRMLIQPCACGCGTIIYRKAYLLRKYPYVTNHDIKGKTYKEIYGTCEVACGFKKGDENVAKRDDVRKKISDGVKDSYTDELKECRREQLVGLIDEGRLLFKTRIRNKYGDLFCSKLEARFAELLTENGIEYKSQHVVKLFDGRRKIVDFCLPNKSGDILVEISGYAYDAWRKDFKEKMSRLRKSVDNQIIVLTYPEYLRSTDGIYQVVMDKNLYVGSIYDESRILKTIQFCKFIDTAAKQEKVLLG